MKNTRTAFLQPPVLLTSDEVSSISKTDTQLPIINSCKNPAAVILTECDCFPAYNNSNNLNVTHASQFLLHTTVLDNLPRVKYQPSLKDKLRACVIKYKMSHNANNCIPDICITI